MAACVYVTAFIPMYILHITICDIVYMFYKWGAPLSGKNRGYAEIRFTLSRVTREILILREKLLQWLSKEQMHDFSFYACWIFDMDISKHLDFPGIIYLYDLLQPSNNTLYILDFHQWQQHLGHLSDTISGPNLLIVVIFLGRKKILKF